MYMYSPTQCTVHALTLQFKPLPSTTADSTVCEGGNDTNICNIKSTHWWPAHEDYKNIKNKY